MIKLNIASTKHREDRKEELRIRLRTLPFEYQFWDGKNEIPSRGYRDLFDTYKRIIRANLNEPFIVIVEDDLDPRENFKDLEMHIKEVPPCDVLLGGITKLYGVQSVEKTYFRLSFFRGTHCVVLFPSIYERFLAQESGQHVSDYLGSAEVSKYVVVPFLAYQTNSQPNRYYGKNQQSYDIAEEIKETEQLLKQI